MKMKLNSHDYNNLHNLVTKAIERNKDFITFKNVTIHLSVAKKLYTMKDRK